MNEGGPSTQQSKVGSSSCSTLLSRHCARRTSHGLDSTLWFGRGSIFVPRRSAIFTLDRPLGSFLHQGVELDGPMGTKLINKEGRDEASRVDVSDGGEDTFVGVASYRLDDAGPHQHFGTYITPSGRG